MKILINMPGCYVISNMNSVEILNPIFLLYIFLSCKYDHNVK